MNGRQCLSIGALASLLLAGVLLTTTGSAEAAAGKSGFQFFTQPYASGVSGEWYVWLATLGSKAYAEVYPDDELSRRAYHPRNPQNLWGSGKIKKSKTRIALQDWEGAEAGEVSSQFKGSKAKTSYVVTVPPGSEADRQHVLLKPSKARMKMLAGIYQSPNFGAGGYTQRLILEKSGKFTCEVRLDGTARLTASGVWQGDGEVNQPQTGLWFVTTQEQWTGPSEQWLGDVFIPPLNSPAFLSIVYPLPAPDDGEAWFHNSWVGTNATYSVLLRVKE